MANYIGIPILLLAAVINATIMPELRLGNGTADLVFLLVMSWALLADVTWTRWSRFDELAVEFDNPLQPAIVEEQDWDDTVRISLGAAFRPTERWVLRAGIAYDESPIPDEFQRPRLVVGDRVLVGVGAGYRLSDTVRLDIGYMHSFSEDVEVDISNPGAGRLVGDYDDLGANLFAAQLSVRF